MLDEKQIRQIVQQELQRSNNASRFTVNSIPQHTHDGINSPQIKQENIIPSVSVSGRITFAQETDYTLNLNASFTPSHISLYGLAYNGTERCMVVGSANLGPSFYFQPGQTTTSVITGNVQYPFIDPNINGGTVVPLQSSMYVYVSNGSTTFHGQPGEGHIVDVQWSGTVYARATITSFNRNAVTFHVDTLVAGWEIYTNIVIT